MEGDATRDPTRDPLVDVLVIQNPAPGKSRRVFVIATSSPWELVHDLSDGYLSNPHLYSVILDLAEKFQERLPWDEAIHFLLSDIPKVGKSFAMVRQLIGCDIDIVRSSNGYQFVVEDCPHYIVGNDRHGKIMELSHNQMASIQKLANASYTIAMLAIHDLLGEDLSAFDYQITEAIAEHSELKVVKEESAPYQ